MMINASDSSPNFDSKAAQEQLIAYLRHELRTPINAIIGYSEMLLEEAVADNNSSFIEGLEEIDRGGRSLLSTVNILLASTPISLEVSTFDQILRPISLKLLTPVDQVLENTKILIKQTKDINTTSDLVKIQKAAQNFKEMLLNITDIVNNYRESLKEKNKNIKHHEVIESKTPSEIKDKKGNILIVDDNINNVDLLLRYLNRLGHTGTSALSGAQALERLTKENYDLILLDLIMPETNGYELLVKLKADKRWQHIPVIMISALDEMNSVIQCIEEGAEDFLPKPFDTVLLKARIDSSLEKKRLRDAEQRYLEILNKELEKGQEIQKNFLPDPLLSKQGWEFKAFFRPARQMAGDFYDLFELGDNQVGLVIADVCDKGVGAALFMGLFRSLIRIFSGQTFLDGLKLTKNEILSTETELTIPDNSHINALAAIEMTNNYIAQNHGEMGMFATLFFGVLNVQNGQLTYINGGHEPLLIINYEGKIKEKLSSTGAAVGMLPDLTFKVKQTQLEIGDILFGYTDGVPEARAPLGAFFTDKKLLSIIEQPINSGSALIDKVSEQVLAHISTEDQFDDITMLAVHRLGEFNQQK